MSLDRIKRVFGDDDTDESDDEQEDDHPAKNGGSRYA